jgi:hypothetical protein
VPTRPDVEALRTAQSGITALVERDLSAHWSSLNLSNPERVRDELIRYVPALVESYGESAASVAADWYDDQRAAARISSRFRALAAAPTKAELIESQVRFGAGHLFTATPEETLAFLSGAAQKYVLAPGRATVAEAAISDPASSGWERVTSGDACDFCTGLAGRGAVYSEASVDFAAHGHCNCAASPVWDSNERRDVREFTPSERTAAMTPEQRAAHNKRTRDWLNG